MVSTDFILQTGGAQAARLSLIQKFALNSKLRQLKCQSICLLVGVTAS